MTDKNSNKRSSSRGGNDFSVLSFLWRVLASLLLVLASYNPTRFSYWSWLESAWAAEPSQLGPAHFVVGIVLLIGWVILLSATRRSLGFLGLVLGAALLGGLVWLLVDVRILNLESLDAAKWVGLVCVSLLLAIGLSWSHLWRRMTGQLEVDDD